MYIRGKACENSKLLKIYQELTVEKQNDYTEGLRKEWLLKEERMFMHK